MNTLHRILGEVVIFGPGLWTVLAVILIVAVILYLFQDKMDPMIRRICLAVIFIVFGLWLISLVSGAPVWVR